MHLFVTGMILIVASVTMADRCTEEFERGIMFTAQPGNVMVCAHETAIFSCNYTGSTAFPLWLINSTTYLSSGLPGNIMYNGRTRQLIVSDVTDDQNYVTFQCYFHIVNEGCDYFITSAVGTLLISSPDSCLCREDLFFGCQGTTIPGKEIVTPTECVPIEMDTPSHDQSVTIISLAISLGLAFLIILIMIPGFCFCFYHKKQNGKRGNLQVNDTPQRLIGHELQPHGNIANNEEISTRSTNSGKLKKIGSIFVRRPQLEESQPLLPTNDQNDSDSQSDDYLEDTHVQNETLNDEDVRYLDPEKMAICEVITTIFKRHGAVTLKTPLFEYTAKEKDSALYDLEESCLYHVITKKKSFSLRYDLTVPFAKYLAKKGCTKMKRYQVDTIYRDGRDSLLFGPQLESHRCDFDIAGEFDLMVPEAECLKIIVEILSELKFDMKRICIKVSHYKILKKLFVDMCGCSVDEFKQICTKVVRDPNHDWLNACESVLNEKSHFMKDQLTQCVNLNDLSKSELMSFARDEVEEMKTLLRYCEALGINEKITLDLSLPLYLNYYTGLIYEARFQSGYEQEVMLAAGGRYDEMVEKINPGCHIPCVGFSVLIERIFKHLNEREHLNLDSVRTMPTNVLVASDHDQGCLTERMELCAGLWKADIQAEFAYKEDPNLDEQLQYCSENDIPFCVIVKNGERKIRDMKKGCEECFTSNDDVITKLTKEIRERKEMSPFRSKQATSTYV